MRKGFSLLEVLIGMLILVISVAGIISAFIYARDYISRSYKRMVCLNLARDVLERLTNEVRMDTWDTTGRLRPTATEVSFDGTNITVGISQYQRWYNVTDVDINGDGIEEYRQVVVRVNEI